MPWAAAGAVVSAAGSIYSGMQGASAAKSAAGQQAQQQQNSLNWIQQVYGNAGTNLQPFIGTGQNALTSLQGFYGLPGGNTGNAQQAFSQFQQTPFYQFPLQQANLATNRSLAASGLTNSGGALRDVSQLNAGYASQGLGQYLSGLGTLAGGGQSAASQLAGVGIGTIPGVGNAYTGIGNANAAGTVGAFNSANSGLSNALPFLTGTPGANPSQSSYGNGTPAGGGLIGAASGSFSGNGLFSANSLNSNFGTSFGSGTFPTADNPSATVPGYQPDNYTPIGY